MSNTFGAGNLIQAGDPMKAANFLRQRTGL
jgi:hypothetical protein